MIYRIFYSIKQAWCHRQELSRINAQAYLLSNVDFKALVQAGKKAIVFDYDGVLASYGHPEPDAVGTTLLKEAIAHFKYVYILSNKPTPSRQAYFNAHYPAIKFMIAKRKKPFPEGLLAIIEDSHMTPQEICLIDDRLLTGALACILAHVTPIFIHDPRIDYSYHFVIECAFQGLRKLEQFIFRGKS